MVKVKNIKSKNMSTGRNNVNKLKGPSLVKTNPFEIHVNRQKHDIIGRKLKNDRGLPGVSRAKAIKKRKATLLQEYKIKNKANEFVDRRIGERNREMTAEDRVIARFTAERVKSKRKSIFNLADDEVLTHRGQTLNEIEKFDDPRSDDEEDDRGRLEADFVSDVHFGGGFFKRKEDCEYTSQSRQNLIQQLISESKKRKAEKQRESEKTAALTDQLDAAWKDLQPVFFKDKKKSKAENEEEDLPKAKLDSYDMAVRELKFEARGKPSDRLKSEEEIALEEKERLEKLEADRLQRMHGLCDSNNAKKKHRSADDLDDGFEIEEAEEMLSYSNAGELQYNGTDKSDLKASAESDSVEIAELSDEDSNKQDSQSDSEESGEESGEDLDDLRYSSGEEEERISTAASTLDTQNTANKEVVTLTPKETEKKQSANKIREDLLVWKAAMDTARQELPYVFKVPENYEEFQSLVADKNISQQSVVLERMIKCSHPSLGAGNKERLNTLFAFILQWLHDDASERKNEVFEINPNQELLKTVLPHLFDIAQLSGAGNARRCVAEVLNEKYEEWSKKGGNKFPGYDTLIFFYLVPHLFPASDFRHPVTSPAIVMMANILSVCQINNLEDICQGLHICQILLQYTTLSNRFLPESIRFLLSVLTLATPEKASEEIIEEFAPTSDKSATGRNWKTTTITSKGSTLHFHNVLDASLSILLSTAAQMKEQVPSWSSIMQTAVEILQQIPMQEITCYPEKLVEKIELLKCQTEENTKLEMLVAEKKRPKPLKMFEPAIEKVFEGKRQGPMSEKKKERLKLRHKFKREMKGAIREIRRDRSFLANLKLKETLKSDAERKEKVKQIMGSLAVQAGEINKLDRKRKNKR